MKKQLKRRRTFPGFLPMLHLDHIYYDGPLELLALDVHRTRKSLMASDHLPLVADFKYLKGVEPATSPGAAGDGDRRRKRTGRNGL